MPSCVVLNFHDSDRGRVRFSLFTLLYSHSSDFVSSDNDASVSSYGNNSVSSIMIA